MKPLLVRCLLVLLLSLSWLLVGSCRKPEPEPDAVPLPAELKAYTLFLPGTYWIYQDSASRQLDSVWVVAADKEIFRQEVGGTSKRVALKYEAFTLYTHSSVSGINYRYKVQRECDLPFQEDRDSKGPCWVVERGRYQPNSTMDGGRELVFPYSIDRDKPTFLVAYTAVMYPYWYSKSHLLSGKSYENIMEVKLTNDASEAGAATHYYWVPGKGIVLHRIRRASGTQTWILLRSYIVQ